MNSFKAVLFDLDGTLLDTIEDLTDSMNAALAARGLPACTVDQCKYFVGDGVVNFVLRAMGEAARGGAEGEKAVAAVMEAYRLDYSRRWSVKTRPYEGICDLLDELVRRGLRMAVLSNKPDEFTRLMVARLLPKWTFDAVWGQREGRPQKPDPAAALQIAAGMGLRAEQFLYLGDTNTDMKTAVAAGMFAVGVLWGFRTAHELVASGARAIIAHPTDLLKLL